MLLGWGSWLSSETAPCNQHDRGLLHICVQVEQQEGPWPRAASKGQGPRLLGEHALARSFQRELLHGPWHLVEVLLIRVGLLGIDPLTGRGFDCCVDQGLLRIL